MKNTKNKTNKIISAFLLLLASVCWGGAFVAQSLAGRSVGTYTFNGIRFLIGGACLMPFFLYQRGGISKIAFFGNEKNEPEKKKIPFSKLLGGFICGMALFLASTFQQAGIAAGAGSGEAGFITSFYIILVPVIGIFLGKKNSKNIYFAVVIALIGLYFLCFPGNGEEVSSAGAFVISHADILLLGCAFLFAIQILGVDHYAPIMSPIALTCIQFFVAGVLSCICGFLFEYLPDPGAWIVSMATSGTWISILYTGIFSSAVGYTLQAVGQRNLNPTVASLIMSMESVFATLFGWIILGQVLSARQALGCVLVFSAIIISQVKKINDRSECQLKSFKIDEDVD